LAATYKTSARHDHFQRDPSNQAASDTRHLYGLLTNRKRHNYNKINVLQELNVYLKGKYAALLSIRHSKEDRV
jgi:hypothetical protein